MIIGFKILEQKKMRMNKRERNKNDKMFIIIEAGGWILGIYYTVFFCGNGPEPCGTMRVWLCVSTGLKTSAPPANQSSLAQ